MATVMPCKAVGKEEDIPPGMDYEYAKSAVRTEPVQLEVIVNGISSGLIVPVFVDSGVTRMHVSDLQAMALPVDGDPASLITLEEMDGVSVKYDSPNQRLALHVPVGWLASHQLSLGANRNFGPARSSFGMMFNYDLYALDAGRGSPIASLWTDFRVFGQAGLLTSTGVLRSSGGGTSYLRYDTRLIRSNEATMTTYEVGDIITRSLPWSSAIRLGGIQISRDFSVRSDVVTYPVPAFAGEAALPSSVELFIDSHQAFGGTLQSGPFTINPTSLMTGAGRANIVVTDALGRQTSTSTAFYVASTLLRSGLTDYAVAAGAVRRKYGQRSNAYGDLVVTGSVRHGLADMLTLEGHGEAGQDAIVLGLGAVLRVGVLGVTNVAYSRSRLGERDGSKIAAGYQYFQRNFSFALNHFRQSAEFGDLSSFERGRQRATRVTSVSGSVALDRFGSLGLGYIDSYSANDSKVRLINASWSVPVRGISSFSASVTRDVRTRLWNGTLNFQVPLGGSRGTIGSNLTRQDDGRYATRIGYNRQVPTQGGLGWSASAARLGGGEIYASGDVTWRSRFAELRGGAYGRAEDMTRWFGASGSVIWMDDALFIANRVSDAFMLVSTGGHAGVPVYYENQIVGRTDANGHVLVPWAAAYYPGKYRIDPLELSDDLAADVIEQQVAVARGSGYVLDFSVRRMIAAQFVLVDKTGVPLPLGTIVRINGSGVVHVGWDGLVFAENLASANALAASLPEGGQCRVSFDMDVAAGGISDKGILTCE